MPEAGRRPRAQTQGSTPPTAMATPDSVAMTAAPAERRRVLMVRS